MINNLYEIFGNKKPLIGMIHLAGEGEQEKIKRALEEIAIFEEEGIDGAILEDYHGEMHDVYDTLKEVSKLDFKIALGLNVLKNPYLGLVWADELGAKFVQFDSVQTNEISPKYHRTMRKKYPEIVVLGGVRFKYTLSTGKSLEKDIEDGKSRCEAIVTTGEGTGIETPIQKLRNFKKILRDFPLISGAGVNKNNIKEQLSIADGAIIGSYFKDYNTQEKIKRHRVRELVQAIKS